MSDEVEQLVNQFNKFDEKVVRYVCGVVCGGNANIARETLTVLTPEQASQILGNVDTSPKKLTEHQKNLISNFKSITGVKFNVAEKYLNNNAWRLEEAINSFFESGAKEAQNFSESKEGDSSIEELFKKYAKANDEEEDDDRLSTEALIEFCKDLDVDPQKDIIILIISWLLDAKGNYTISKDEWMNGFERLGCDGLNDIKANLEKWRISIKDKKSLKSFYRFVFGFSVVSKTMKPELAAQTWKLLFSTEQYPLLDDWCKFVVEVYKKAVTKDTWFQFFDFLNEFPDSKSVKEKYSDEECWPSIIDEFVDYIGKKDEKKTE